MTLTRRTLLTRIGLAGGYGATAAALNAIGLAGAACATEFTALPPTLGHGLKVVVLGAGISGLVSAYELEQAGFEVTLLEARGRVGGRAWTTRSGDKVEMVGEDTQTARWSDGVYMNMGPARIPSFHQGLLGYARRCGVPMEVEVNASRSAYVLGADGRRIRMRTAINDMRGHIAELLTKAIGQGSLDSDLTPADKEKLLPFLQAYGDLDEHGRFVGTERSGFGQAPGAGLAFSEPGPAMSLEDLLANGQLPGTFFEENLYMQATMFQPVGGMDRIHAGIDRHLRRPSRRGAVVSQIRQSPRGVTVTWRDAGSGAVTTTTADYMVCTIPFSVLKAIDTDFSAPVAAAVAGVEYDHSNKVGFEGPRFWERDQIYGGISFVGPPTSLVWYPSASTHSDRGMILGCYNSGKLAATFQQQPIADQIAASRGAIDKVHPGHGADLTNALAVNWHKVPYSLGPWPSWSGQNGDRPQEGHIDTPGFRLLQQPDGRIYFASAALSQTPGWQEGGIQSAQAQVLALAQRVRATALTERRAQAAA